MQGGPLGKYSQAVAAVLATIIIVAAIGVRIVGAFVGNIPPTPFLDNIALIAMGAVFGASAATAVNGNAIQAAHRRLDEIAAPPADYLHSKAAAAYDQGAPL
jgi:hypothetical protein